MSDTAVGWITFVGTIVLLTVVMVVAA